MRVYYRPVAQTDPAMPSDAYRLAGSAYVWFTQVERITRNGGNQIMPASDVPQPVLDNLTRAHGADTRLMGVLNTTPDSFSDGGRFVSPDAAVAHARQMVEQGADILDIGGESTRPGAALVPVDVEIARTAPVIEAIRAAGLSVPISIDTRKGEVARAALAAGATMLNDVSALSFDAEMA